jgi:tetratricopeptide (TPR) repeat protein
MLYTKAADARDVRAATAKVLRLDEHRDRREHRARVAEALYRRHPDKHAIFRHLREIAALTRADRVGAVWIDEYGSGLVHPYVVLDLLNDRPRREFPIDPLQRAWDLGLPGAYDGVAASPKGRASTLALALGSDGSRAWFVTADSLFPRPKLDSELRERVLFLAGECSAVLLHRDMDLLDSDAGDASFGRRFEGWSVLQDLDEEESDEAAKLRIERRFVVARLARLLVNDDLATPSEHLREQARNARPEVLGRSRSDDPETAMLERLLDALDACDFESLAQALVDLGDAAEATDHHHGALELYGCAYDVAAAVGAVRPAVEAARLSGRLQRRRAQWDESVRWYGNAGEIAATAGMDDRAAMVVTGLGRVRQEIGNLPAAREEFLRALDLAKRSGDADTIASVHRALLSLEHAAGNLAAGLEHGWIAVAAFQSPVERTRCLAALAGALVAFGDREAAEDAWSVVAHESHETYYRIYAHDALAYLAALRGDAEAFEEQAAACDALGWETGPRAAKAEILYYRGLSYGALGQRDVARAWLQRATAFAAEHRFNRTLFEAERALADLAATPEPEGEKAPAAPPEVRDGLRAMRRALVPAGV